MQHHDIDKFLLIRLQKSNYQRQNLIILNFSAYKVLKMKFQQGKRQKIKDFTDETSFKNIFAEYSIMISTNFLLIRLQKSNYFQGQISKMQKSNYYRQNFFIINFSEYKVLKMKFQHRKRHKIKDFTDEISSKYIFEEYSIMISTNFYT